MQVLRCTQPEHTVRLLAPYLLEDSDYDKETMLQMLLHHMTATPEQIQVLVAFDENQVLGHTITFAEQGTVYTFILQAWVSNKAPKGLAKKLLSRVEAWTEDLGRKSIRMETRRKESGFIRRFNFQPFSSIMELPVGLEHELTEDTTVDIGTPPPDLEIYNGQEVQSEEHDPRADESAELSGELSVTAGGNGGDVLRAAFDRSTDPGDAVDPEPASISEFDGGPLPAKRSPVTITERGAVVHPGQR
jgi:hypothetical protein